MANSETNLFAALEQALQTSLTPLDCTQLYAMPEIRKNALSPNRVSDYLGNLWRKGLVYRLPAPNDGKSRTRWLYEWKVGATPAADRIEYTPRVLADRPSLLITEQGSVVTLEMPCLIVSIRQKQAAGFGYLEGLKDS
jgi:hypothetical protein